jgi:DNA-cytosine methyltransferase
MTEPKFDLDVVLSLFDGISCGQEALRKAGISTRIYLASEIEKYPKQITRKNHPLTVQLGDVTKVVADDLPHVNLLMGGSPCQGFSFAGKQLNFDDPRSALFFEFVRLLKECKPDYFLLENVMMKQEYQDVITEHLGVEPVMINSSLLSAQNRKRLYWTNIPGVSQPDDEGLFLQDILDYEEDKTLSDKEMAFMLRSESTKKHLPRLKARARYENQKSNTLTYSMHKGVPYGVVGITQPKDKGILLKDVLDYSVTETLSDEAMAYMLRSESTTKNIPRLGARARYENQKSNTLTTSLGSVPHGVVGITQPREPKVLIVPEKVKVRKHEVDIPKLQALLKEHRKPMREISKSLNVKKTTVEHWFRTDNCFSIPDADVWFNLKEYLNINTDEFDASITEFEIRDGRYDMADRVYNPEYKAPTVVASNVSKVLTPPTYRKLTPKECERLQTLPDNYTEGVSNSQRYRALGNGWTVDVIVHILQGLKQQTKVVAA